jgi:hypothetical protein
MVRLIKAHLLQLTTIEGTVEELIRGYIKPQDLKNLDVQTIWKEGKFTGYQRAPLSFTKRHYLHKLFASKTPLTEMVAATDGVEFNREGDIFTINSQVCVIDGQQRGECAKEILEKNANYFQDLYFPYQIRLGYNLDKQRRLFLELNMSRARIEADTKIANMIDESIVLKSIFLLTEDDKNSDWPLYQKIGWGRGGPYAITTSAFVNVTSFLHGVFLKGTNPELPKRLDGILSKFTIEDVVENTKLFWENMAIWRMTREFIKEQRNLWYFRSSTVEGIAKFIQSNNDFWDNERLVFVPPLFEKSELWDKLHPLVEAEKNPSSDLVKSLINKIANEC